MHYFNKHRLTKEEELEENERASHVFPLLTFLLWYAHTWFSLECCLWKSCWLAVLSGKWKFKEFLYTCLKKTDILSFNCIVMSVIKY